MLMLPKGLVVTFTMLLIALLTVMLLHVVKKRKEEYAAYESLSDEVTMPHAAPSPSNMTLETNQKEISSKTNLLEKQGVITYCMIDDRLIDE